MQRQGVCLGPVPHSREGLVGLFTGAAQDHEVIRVAEEAQKGSFRNYKHCLHTLSSKEDPFT